MYLYHNIENDLVIDVQQIMQRNHLIQLMKQRFQTFGYQEIHTSTFEPYDLYVQMNGTVNHEEMMKTIDNTGKVLVMRPDITIPLTQRIASHNKQITEDLRYFYVLDVFRQTKEKKDNRESTQAGVEYFGNPTPEADAEVIFLAIQLLKDVHPSEVKIEFGHAGFFKQLIKEMQLKKQDLHELQQLIQAKNMTEIEQFLSPLSIQEEIKEIVTSLPFLYGEPSKVIEKAKTLPLRPEMVATLENLAAIYEQLQAYGVEKQMVLDLSLINHMDYYSDVIFQGFMESIGKPVIMGGRYNTLANQFGADIPAIGFACELDLLPADLGEAAKATPKILDVQVLYDPDVKKAALLAAYDLRERQYETVIYPLGMPDKKMPAAAHTLKVTADGFSLTTGEMTSEFTTMEQIIDVLEKE